MGQRMDYARASPEGYQALRNVYAKVQSSGLDPVLIDLVYLRVSQINGCAYCIDMHSRDLLARGLSVDQLVLVPVWREAPALFSRSQGAALAWAEALTCVAQTGVSDDDYAAVSAVFNDKEVADLSYAVGLMNAFNRLGVAFRMTPAAARP